jgi:hypothetical protein
MPMTPAVINIVSAEFIGDYKIRLAFDDATQQLVDFKPFLSRSVHPDIRKFLNADRFVAFRVDRGDLVWGDYDLCFPIIDLYRNQLENPALLSIAA